MFPHKFTLATAHLGHPLSTAALLSTFGVPTIQMIRCFAVSSATHRNHLALHS